MIWKYIVPIAVTLIIVGGAVIVIRTLANLVKSDEKQRRNKRNERLIRDLHRNAIKDAVDDPTSRQTAYAITDHYLKED